MKRCLSCNKRFDRLVSLGRCLDCHYEYDKAKGRAHGAVRAAIRDGLLPHAKTLPCADCGGLSREYDHRDYTQPLNVAPVCHGCNLRRGAGYWPPRVPAKRLERAT